MSTFTIYPRGFTSGPEDASEVVNSKGCPAADGYYDLFANSLGNPIDMGFYDALLGYALQQFGDFETWLDLQLSNPSLVGPKTEYLVETINFALRGQPRAMSQYSWSFLLGPSEIKQSSQPNRLYRAKKFLGGGISTTQALQCWCSQDDGVKDLVLTLHVLFGHAGRTPA